MFWVVDLLPVSVGSWVDCTGGVTSALGGRSLVGVSCLGSTCLTPGGPTCPVVTFPRAAAT